MLATIISNRHTDDLETEQTKFSGMAKDARKRFRDFLLTLDRINPFFLEKCVRCPNGSNANNLPAKRNSYARLSISESEDEFRSSTKWKARSKGNRRSLAKSRFRHSVLATGGEFENLEKALLISLTDLTDNHANSNNFKNEQLLPNYGSNSASSSGPGNASNSRVENTCNIDSSQSENTCNIDSSQLEKPTKTTFFVTSYSTNGVNDDKTSHETLHENSDSQSKIEGNGENHNLLDMDINTFKNSTSLHENRKLARGYSNHRRSVHNSYKKIPTSYDLLDVSDVQMNYANQMDTNLESPKDKITTKLKSDIGKFEEYKLPEIIPDFSGQDFPNIARKSPPKRSSIIVSDEQNRPSFNKEQKRRLKKKMKEALKSPVENYSFMGNI